jgi:hypothetical protein
VVVPSVTPALRRLRQEGPELEANLGYLAQTYFQKTKGKKRKEFRISLHFMDKIKIQKDK